MATTSRPGKKAENQNYPKNPEEMTRKLCSMFAKRLSLAGQVLIFAALSKISLVIPLQCGRELVTVLQYKHSSCRVAKKTFVWMEADWRVLLTVEYLALLATTSCF